MVGIPTGRMSPQCIICQEFPSLYLDQQITQQPIRGHIPYSTDSPTTTRLWNSLLGIIKGDMFQPMLIYGFII